jgi:putative spermidine/putrescine transport system permease protein
MKPRSLALGDIWLGAVIVYLIAPIAATIWMSFSSSRVLTFPPDSLSLRWYHAIAMDERWIDAITNSVLIGVLAATLAILAGGGIALAAWGGSSRLGKLLTAIALVPAVMPVVVLAVALYLFLAPAGLIGSVPALAASHALLGMPLAFVAVYTALRYFDRQLLEAAASMGASRWQAWWTVLLPSIRPALIAGAMLALFASFDEAIVATFVGRAVLVTLPNLMFSSVRFELSPAVAAMSTLVLVVNLALQSLVLLWFARRIRRATASTFAAGPAEPT